MLKWSRLAFLGLLTILPSTLTAQDILDGWYWNPNESGWGINVEVQGDTMFIAVFTYRENGSPIWYYGVSAIDYSDPVFDGNLGLASNGACFTCPYSPPGFDDDGGGHMRIDFDTPSGIRVTWRGRTTTIQRQFWAFGVPIDFLFGYWGLIRGIEVPFADYYVFNSRQTDDSGAPFAAGQALDESIVVAQWFEDETTFAMLNRKSSGDWYYEFLATKQFMIGRYWILDVGESPIGSGTEFIATRIGQQEIPKSLALAIKLSEMEAEHFQVRGKLFSTSRLDRHLSLVERVEMLTQGAH